MRAGIVDKIKVPLKEYEVWDKGELEPSVEVEEESMQFAREGNFEDVIGVSGRSSLDIAKTATTGLTNSEPLKELVKERFKNPLGLLILIPTTSGIGSEVSNAAVFASSEVKYVLYSPNDLSGCRYCRL